MRKMPNECLNTRPVLGRHWDDDDIVISGIAGRFPDSNNVLSLKENLMNKVDLISDDDRRWKHENPEIPQRTGKVNNIDKFDSLFFGIHSKQAQAMDPMSRMLLEHTYEATIDAGINPRQLRGTKIGVFIGCGVSEAEKTLFYETTNGFGLSGCSRAMLANRISYWLGVTGPSYTIDSACSSSLTAMENAYRAIRDGQCEAAYVGGANLCLHPNLSLQFARLGVLAPDGCSRIFDADATGYTRGEAIGLVFLQKAKNAKRIYATYVHGKINCDGFKEEGITFPSSIMQSNLLNEFYKECGIPPTIVSYVEAHGTGTLAGDPEEVNALDQVFCPGRKTPLKIGSVKSNLGHAEAASGICSITKAIIALESGIIPPHLNYSHPREVIKALEENRIEVVTEATPLEGAYIGVNSFGFGGVNAHILLKSNPKEKINNGVPKDDLPRLVVVSGRTEEAVDCILKDLENRPVDAEYVRLIQDIHSEIIPGHMYRGYTIVGGSANQENPIREIQHYSGAKPSVWYIFTGMGCQWAGMGTAFLRLPVFANAIKKCDAVLKPLNFDIYDILTNEDPSTFNNVLNSVVGIAATQIGLVDLLSYVGIVPDNMIGHSFGELGCAYADGCLTAEETVLAAYYRGCSVNETDMICGSMAAVGLGYREIQNLCPPDIEVACHNGPKSSTISGPVESIKAFVAKLQEMKIFARGVASNNIAFHSRYITDVAPKLFSYLKQVIRNPKQRSAKWISSSMHSEDWDKESARFSSAQYHTNNFLKPVLFAEASVFIPHDAVTIEIAPHGLLQAILRRSLHPDVTNIGLTTHVDKDNVEIFLQGLGKLFNVGLLPKLAKLYPDIQFPVSRGTPMLSPLVRWEHTDDWYVPSFPVHEKIQSGGTTIKISLEDEEYEYLTGYIIDGKNSLPATAYLTFVWETVAMMRGKNYRDVSVVFKNVKFLRIVTIPKEGVVELTLSIQKGSERFEVIEGGTIVVTGIIRTTSDPSLEMMNLPVTKDNVVEEMSSNDIYKDLRLRGYNYSNAFRGIKSATIDATTATVAWTNNWVVFMDNMLQLNILDIDSRELLVPMEIQKLSIDTKHHLQTLGMADHEERHLTVRLHKDYDAITAGGIEICGIRTRVISRRKTAKEPVIESCQFIAHRDKAEMTLRDFVTVSAHIAVENHLSVNAKTVEAIFKSVPPIFEDLVSPYLYEILRDYPLIQPDVNIVAVENPFKENPPQNITVEGLNKLNAATAAMLVSSHDVFSDIKMLNQLLLALKNEGFLMTLETASKAEIYLQSQKNSLEIVLEKRVKNKTALLMRKRCETPKKMTIINVESNTFNWIPQLQSALKLAVSPTKDTRIILVSEKDFESGLLGLVRCLRKEPGGDKVIGYLIQDKNAPDFSEKNSLYSDQLKLDLALNVLRENGIWGTYRHLFLPKIMEKPMYHAWVNQLIRGDLESFQWIEGHLKPSYDKSNYARVAYAAINFRDIILAMNSLAISLPIKTRYHQEYPYGIEYSGVDASGKRIMGLVEARGFTNIVPTEKHLVWSVPESWSLEDAATVPCIYATCYDALYLTGKMNKGDKVLIHLGTTGIGQAAITLALHEGCEVFTTVNSPDKRRIIKERFPQITGDHIGSSSDTSFEQLITRQTKGRGVDIVLNSLEEDKLQASIRCLAHGGRILQVGLYNPSSENPLDTNVFLKQITFSTVMLDNLFHIPVEKKKQIHKLLQQGIESGVVKPVTRSVFPKEDIQGAIRHIAAGKHIGKVVIRICDKNETLDLPIKATPCFHCLEDRSYVIIGGLGGIGLEVADWLVLRGAKNLVLTSRRGLNSGYQTKVIGRWKSYGTKVVTIAGKDAYKSENCEYILKTAAKLGPVDGIFNLAGTLRDGLMENQTVANFQEAFSGKAWGTKQLDKVSRNTCPKLRHFVVFSTISSGRGSAGQTNYAMANEMMEKICEKRVLEGLPGLAIQWGTIGDVGLVVDMQEESKELNLGGTVQQSIASCLRELDHFMMQEIPIVASTVVAEKRSGGISPLSLVEMILNIMSLKDIKTVSSHTPLAEIGLDSMMIVELRQTLEREFEIYLNPQEIRSLNFSKILEMSTKEAS